MRARTDRRFMCGILGLATVSSRRVSVDTPVIERMRDMMAHRGPDGAGIWAHENVVLAHRRLAVVDLSPGGHQPMVTADGRFALVYNGELYNDGELRAELAGAGARFATESDTETVLRALAHWGPGAMGRFRGMYAVALVDTRERTVLLARDPLGIKPLVYALARVGGGEELVFASEAQAILAHPGISARPDPVAMSAYLTTIRTVMGERTLFEGIRTLRPGQALIAELGGDSIRIRDAGVAPGTGAGDAAAGGGVRASVEDSLTRHLRSDVPICCLLSGGLDSSILASIAVKHVGALHTYCSGAAGETIGASPEDFACARLVSSTLGTEHTEAPITREMFRQRWPEMVAAMGVPLSTPNEVAINEVARALRARGHVVALSGEGADELFAGYEIPMLEAARFEGVLPAVKGAAGVRARHPGEFQLVSNAWVSPENKGAVLNPDVWRGLESDAVLLEFYRSEFDAVAAAGPIGAGGVSGGAGEGMERLQAHLRFHRRINLSGLLSRLDSATMLASVEGRTPLADVCVAGLAESLPMGEKFEAGPGGARTKIALRAAFAADLPGSIVTRPKASFPLPFQAWAGDNAGVLRTSALSRQIFTEAAIHTVSQNPSALWQLAWPMINLAMWGRRYWG